MPEFSRTARSALPDGLDICGYKQTRLLQCAEGLGKTTPRARVGLPLQLGIYEQLPVWSGFFETLGFEIVLPDPVRRPCHESTAACLPAKLVRSQIADLLESGVDFIFMPCERFIDGQSATTDANCSVFSYYPEILRAENERLTPKNFIAPYLDLTMRSTAVKSLKTALSRFNLNPSEIKRALNAGFASYKRYHDDIRKRTGEILARADTLQKQIIVLAGRPYYLDLAVNRGVNGLLASLNAAVVTDDSLYEKGEKLSVTALISLPYRARLLRAVDFVSKRENAILVQLTSTVCDFDAQAAEEVRTLLAEKGKPYMQINID